MANSSSPQRSPRSILLIQLGDIGDAVLTLPCIDAVRETFPNLEVHVAARKKAAAIFEDCTLVSEIIPIEKISGLSAPGFYLSFFRKLRKRRYDLAIDLRTGDRGAILAFLSGAPKRVAFNEKGNRFRNLFFTHLVDGNFDPQRHMVDHLLQLFATCGMKAASRNPLLAVSEDKQGQARKILAEARVPLDRPIIAIQPFSLWRYKEWGGEKFSELARWIRNTMGLPVIITGGQNERERADTIVRQCGEGVFNLAGETPIALYAAVLQQCSYFIGVDSAGLHLAAAVGVATVGIYGPSPSMVWAPRGERNRIAIADLACIPCRQKGCGGSEKSDCLKALQVEKVASCLGELIAQDNLDLSSI